MAYAPTGAEYDAYKAAYDRSRLDPNAGQGGYSDRSSTPDPYGGLGSGKGWRINPKTGQYEQVGGWNGATVDPNDPYGWMLNDPRANMWGEQSRQLGIGGRSGIYNPNYSWNRAQDIANMFIQKGGRAAGDTARRVGEAGFANRGVLADLTGGWSPNEYRRAYGAQRGGVSDAVAQAVNQATMQGLDFQGQHAFDDRNWYRDLYGQSLGASIGANASLQDYNQQRGLNQQQIDQSGRWQDILGGIIGTGVGAYAGGLGGAMAPKKKP